MNTHVYIDGFNLYYQVRRTPYKWLNIKAMADLILGAKYTVSKVKYYTAHVSGAVDPTDPINQQMYLRALATVPEVEPHFGRFLAKPIWRPLLCVPIAGRALVPAGLTVPAGLQQVAPSAPGEPAHHMYVGTHGVPSPSAPATNAIKVRVHDTEEKGSDVNLAVHLLNDAWKNVYDVAAIMTNDTDLCEAMRIVRDELKKQVVLLCPVIGKNPSKPLQDAASTVRHLNASHLKGAQFPDPVPAPAGWAPIIKPGTW